MRKKLIIVVVAIVALGVGGLTFYRFFFLHFVRIPTGSMANTVIPGDYLVVRKRSFGEVQRGDLIVFRYPEDLSTYFLSRVTGLPGETLEVRGKIVYINDQPLMEQRVTVKPDDLFESEYLEELSSEGIGNYRVFYQAGDDSVPQDDPARGPFQMPADHYFVMGDNRDNSLDSRYRGAIPKDLIFGKAFMIYWSQNNRASNERIRWDRVFTRIK
jgi:signal peptidase I